jgi:hypothetical protein
MRQAREDWREHRYSQAVTGFIKREWPVIAWAISFVALAVVILQVNALAARTTDSLCALRSDLERRVETSRQFLEENPHGIPGITPAYLRTSIENQERTVEALSDLDCPPAAL